MGLFNSPFEQSKQNESTGMTEAQRRAYAFNSGVEYFCVENYSDETLKLACDAKKEWDDQIKETLRRKREEEEHAKIEHSAKEFERKMEAKRQEREHAISKLMKQDFDSMEGIEFEFFCTELLRKNGFECNTTKGSGDHGADIIARYNGTSYAFQCKRKSDNIGNKAVQEALSGKIFYKTEKAIVLTNQYFTAQAKEDAKAMNVELWDRDTLLRLINGVWEP